MIRQTRETATLKALQAVVIKARSMAYEGVSHRRIADLLDRTEYLVALIYDERDMTEAFRSYLEEITEAFDCRNALEALKDG